MSIFSRFHGEAPPSVPEHSQLQQILEKIKADPKIYPEILKQLSERNPTKFKSEREAQRFIDSATTDADALGVAKLIDQTLGAGTYRTLSFLDSKQDSAKSVYKLLRGNIESASFEKQVEKGYYLNLLETYGVQWSMEKVSRDSVQNFFDANGATLDGVDIKTEVEEKMDEPTNTKKKTAKVTIQAGQDYDWKELIHFGGTTKQDSETSVGGFGEGIKIAAFISIRDFGAKEVKAASRDWELEYYFDNVASDAYRKQVRGLYAKKRTRKKQEGNYLEIVFEGDDADKKAKAFEDARELFYSSENSDFKEPSFDNKESGGFKVIPYDEGAEHSWDRQKNGRLYLAGQRTHYDSRDKWETVADLNLWTWKKVQPKDRDRGMITRSEMTADVLPLIVESMTQEELTKSVYDFKTLWEHLSSYSASDKLLELIVNKLADKQVKLEFEKDYLADDIPSGFQWITELLKQQGNHLCRHYLKKVGMKGALERVKELMSLDRVEATPVENKQIGILQEAARKIGLTNDEVKDVWIFNAGTEKNIIHGKYTPEFYWLAKEVFDKPFIDAIHDYVHESSHKEGSHGEQKFEYFMESQMRKIQKFSSEHREEWDELKQRWNSAGGNAN